MAISGRGASANRKGVVADWCFCCPSPTNSRPSQFVQAPTSSRSSQQEIPRDSVLILHRTIFHSSTSPLNPNHSVSIDLVLQYSFNWYVCSPHIRHNRSTLPRTRFCCAPFVLRRILRHDFQFTSPTGRAFERHTKSEAACLRLKKHLH
jgi:hypothetical protein